MRSNCYCILIAFLVQINAVVAQEKPGPFANLSPFGIGSCYTNNRSVEDNARWIPKLAEIGVTVHRTPHTDWGAIEPAQGKFSWEVLDKQLKYLEEHKFRYGIILAGTPKWNTKDAPGSLPINNLTGWSNYVTELSKHVKGKANLYEVWNEPPNFTGKNQTPADYAKIVVASYNAVKAVDPSAQVGLAAKSAHINYLEQVIKAGAKDHFDYIVLHPYEVLDGIAEETGSESIYMHIVPTVRKMLQAQNPAKMNVPIIFTELGCDATKGWDRQAKTLVKAYCMGIAQGVSCIQWFEGRDGDSGPMGLLDEKGNKRLAYTAYGQLIKHLGNHPKSLGWVLLNEKHYGFLFEGSQGKVLATWNSTGEAEVLDFGQEVKITNPLTGNVVSARSYELTNTPILVLNASEKLLNEAKANQGKPFPWGGDYSQASSVSINFGDKIIEKGLHTRSATAVAKAVVAYGGPARAGNVPGGNVYIVDPNFLSYTSTPIEITAVVRRNQANDNSGFKLIYESTDGFKTAGGWYTIPDNKKWHTVTWTIRDSQFVNYWGFNFNLESDGNTYNKYFIQSVTVKKLDK